jgi:hypothetical protein
MRLIAKATKKQYNSLLAPIEVKILVGWGSANKIVTDSGNHYS